MNFNLPIYFFDEFLFGKYYQPQFIAFFCFFFALILLVYSFVVLSKGRGVAVKNKRNKKLEKKELEDIGGEVYQDALKILDKARSDSLKILSRAQARAQGLLDNTYTISQESRRKLDQSIDSIYQKQESSLQDLSEELLESYRDAVEEGKQENIRTLYEATEAMRKEALSGVDDFKNVIQKETLETQNALEEKIREEYAKIDEELTTYKDEKIKSLNNRVFEILSDIYTDVIKEDLDQIKYERMILSMLQEEIEKSGMNYRPERKSENETESN